MTESERERAAFILDAIELSATGDGLGPEVRDRMSMEVLVAVSFAGALLREQRLSARAASMANVVDDADYALERAFATVRKGSEVLPRFRDHVDPE